MKTSVLALGERELEAWDGSGSRRAYLLRVAASAHLEAGDVLLSHVPDAPVLDDVLRAMTQGDTVLRRSHAISDCYSCAFGSELCEAAGLPAPHHTQFRRLALEGEPCLQVAFYPSPGSEGGVRLWCEPAIVWLFLSATSASPSLGALRRLQPLWERVRAHHGVPLSRTRLPGWAARYPVEAQLVPLTVDEVQDLRVATRSLAGQELVTRLTSGATTPRVAVDDTLRSLRVLSLHADRLSCLLDHSHGDAESKLDALAQALELELTATTDQDRRHLFAPHRHLVDGFRETQRQVARTVERASTTAALISSAATGRLLDRSEANRRASTVVAVLAATIALVSIFTAVAAVPASGRQFGDLAALSGWVGAAACAMAVAATVLARAAERPAPTLTPARRRVAGAAQAAVFGTAVGAFLVAGATARALPTLVGLGLLYAAALLRAWVDDY